MPFHLLKVQGCADITTPEHAWHKRSGDVATIGCLHDNATWQLMCDGLEWSGEMGTCHPPGLSQHYILVVVT